MNSNRNWTHTLVILAALCCLGCGQTPLAHVSVSGTVTLDGKPIPDAVILFEPVAPDQGYRTSAMVVGGEFQLDEADGPSPGQYHIVLNPIEPDQNSLEKRAGKKISELLVDYRRLGAAIAKRGDITIDFTPDQSNFVDVALKSR